MLIVTRPCIRAVGYSTGTGLWAVDKPGEQFRLSHSIAKTKSHNNFHPQRHACGKQAKHKQQRKGVRAKNSARHCSTFRTIFVYRHFDVIDNVRLDDVDAVDVEPKPIAQIEGRSERRIELVTAV